MNLTDLGWNSAWEAKFQVFSQQGFSAGRVVAEHKQLYKVITQNGELQGEISGRLRFQALGRGDFPAVGDWVVLQERTGEQRATIHAVLPRKSKFSRKEAGGAVEEQLVAANIDTVFLVNALVHDFNLRRIERYLALAWESGADPVLVLTKADLCEDISDKIEQLKSIALGVPMHVVSTVTREGLDSLATYLQKGQTIALLGSSGVGKSSLINCLAGDELQRVHEVRTSDGRGQHTTTHREMIQLPSGGIMMDTPGMRELQLWEAVEGIETTFEDIGQLAVSCYFSNCKHQNEPGCAILLAIDNGLLNRERYDNYLKLGRELKRIEQKANAKVRQDNHAKEKQRSRYKRDYLSEHLDV
ncbi:MAG: GTPase RsgA [Bacilli bacterium]|nr:GTPase RsgA [Bacilli bacterium]